MKQGAPRTGFTLIELMLVVAIIGLLAAIALPKFGQLVRKAREATLRGNVGALRSALSIYYVDNEGMFPWSGDELIPKYIHEIPRSPSLPGTPHSTSYQLINLIQSFTTTPSPGPNYSPGIDYNVPVYWVNVVSPVGGPWTQSDPRPHALFYVNCAHTDVRGSTWSKF
ncbi:MAG: type II secretion system protein [Elusimicrobia bacterium]|nr:type II secretion system protein [Elusimicrobiota bacterium]